MKGFDFPCATALDGPRDLILLVFCFIMSNKVVELKDLVNSVKEIYCLND